MRLVRGPASSPSESTVAFGSVSAVALLLARLWPFEQLPLWSCPLRRIAGLPCPSCGMTRAFVRVTHGDLAGALKVSPLGLVLALTAALLTAYLAARLTLLRRGPVLETSARERRGLSVLTGLIVLANWSYLLVTRAAG